MKFFINDIPVKISELDSKVNSKHYDRVFEGEISIIPDQLSGNILLRFPKIQQVLTLVRLLQVRKLLKIENLTVITDNKKFLTDLLKRQFKPVRAAGGVVMKDDKILMIYRLGVWDLPKGKFDKGESSEQCALREVEEECNVKVEIVQPLVSTWHSYVTKNGNNYLKKTDWYLMNCLGDELMIPQTEEGIEEIKWMSVEEVKEALRNSYNSIRHVFKKLEKIRAN